MGGRTLANMLIHHNLNCTVGFVRFFLWFSSIFNTVNIFYFYVIYMWSNAFLQGSMSVCPNGVKENDASLSKARGEHDVSLTKTLF